MWSISFHQFVLKNLWTRSSITCSFPERTNGSVLFESLGALPLKEQWYRLKSFAAWNIRNFRICPRSACCPDRPAGCCHTSGLHQIELVLWPKRLSSVASIADQANGQSIVGRQKVKNLDQRQFQQITKGFHFVSLVLLIHCLLILSSHRRIFTTFWKKR